MCTVFHLILAFQQCTICHKFHERGGVAAKVFSGARKISRTGLTSGGLNIFEGVRISLGSEPTPSTNPTLPFKIDIEDFQDYDRPTM